MVEAVLQRKTSLRLKRRISSLPSALNIRATTESVGTRHRSVSSVAARMAIYRTSSGRRGGDGSEDRRHVDADAGEWGLAAQRVLSDGCALSMRASFIPWIGDGSHYLLRRLVLPHTLVRPAAGGCPPSNLRMSPRRLTPGAPSARASVRVANRIGFRVAAEYQRAFGRFAMAGAVRRAS
jgi:hypothetical protein